MATYIVNSDDQASESLLVAYQNQRVGTQSIVARVHGAIVDAVRAEEAFNVLVEPGGQLEALAEYHAAKVAPLVESLDKLRAQMAAVQATMERLEAAVPGLFPGVTAQ